MDNSTNSYKSKYAAKKALRNGLVKISMYESSALTMHDKMMHKCPKKSLKKRYDFMKRELFEIHKERLIYTHEFGTGQKTSKQRTQFYLLLEPVTPKDSPVGHTDGIKIASYFTILGITLDSKLKQGVQLFSSGAYFERHFLERYIERSACGSMDKLDFSLTMLSIHSCSHRIISWCRKNEISNGHLVCKDGYIPFSIDETISQGNKSEFVAPLFLKTAILNKQLSEPKAKTITKILNQCDVDSMPLAIASEDALYSKNISNSSQFYPMKDCDYRALHSIIH